jgi:hypothetical protein
MEGMLLEKRTYKRDALMEIVHYAPSLNSSDAVLRGSIKDWSQSGICLIARQPLENGQEIMVDSIVVPSSKKATVRWQQDIGKDACQVVGVQEIRLKTDMIDQRCPPEGYSSLK